MRAFTRILSARERRQLVVCCGHDEFRFQASAASFQKLMTFRRQILRTRALRVLDALDVPAWAFEDATPESPQKLVLLVNPLEENKESEARDEMSTAAQSMATMSADELILFGCRSF